MTDLNANKKYYFIKTNEKSHKDNINEIVENANIKIVQSNFPDSIYLPLALSLYGNNITDYILFIEGEDLLINDEKNFIQWYKNAFLHMFINNYDYIFGSYQIVDGKKIGCSILFSKSSIIQHLLFYSDADTTHANPFIQLSLSNKSSFKFIPFKYIKVHPLENTKNKHSSNMKCPSIKDNPKPSLCIMIPSFKRNYFPYAFTAFSKQTYKPKFYVIIQNDNKIQLNLPLIQTKVKEPVYHIWMKNWNSFFFLTHRFSALFPCDFVLKYDDDEWPKDNKINEKLINLNKNNNIMIGRGKFIIGKSICGYQAKKYITKKSLIADHIATPFLIRPGYFKLDARNKIYSIYHAEDLSLSVNSFNLCNVISKFTKMRLIRKQWDGLNRQADKQFKELKINGNHILVGTYCYLIHSGYKPKRWVDFEIPKKDLINITIKHKDIF